MADGAASIPGSKQSDSREEFYVGYLPMPAAHVFYVRLLMPVVLWISVGAAALVSSSQFDPGGGVWNSGQPQNFRGVIDAKPYPLLHVPGGEHGAACTTYLIVETGKFGGGKRVAPFDAQNVNVSGWLIERDGRRMIELDPLDGAITGVPDSPTLESNPSHQPRPRSLGSVTLRGEIVDSKCFLGVMKPGEGKTHKECATLCIRGGIPPVFVAWDGTNPPRHYLLSNSQGTGLDPGFLPFVADPVEITGEVEEVGDILILRASAGAIHRL